MPRRHELNNGVFLKSASTFYVAETCFRCCPQAEGEKSVPARRHRHCHAYTLSISSNPSHDLCQKVHTTNNPSKTSALCFLRRKRIGFRCEQTTHIKWIVIMQTQYACRCMSDHMKPEIRVYCRFRGVSHSH
jgi:hypothetical protein